jgi:hypothetical protein
MNRFGKFQKFNILMKIFFLNEVPNESHTSSVLRSGVPVDGRNYEQSSNSPKTFRIWQEY